MAYAQKVSELAPSYHRDRIVLATLLEEQIKETLLYSGITVISNFAADVRDLSVWLDIPDLTRVRIAIDNIVNNAIRFSRPKGVVEIGLSRDGDTAVLTIQDHGNGISDDDLARIFEPGFARRAPGHPEGTGMGLTTVKQVFDRLLWTCNVSSEVGKGTLFQITIPSTEGD